MKGCYFYYTLLPFWALIGQDLLSTRDNLRDLRTANLPLVMVVGGVLDSFEHLMWPLREKHTYTYYVWCRCGEFTVCPCSYRPTPGSLEHGSKNSISGNEPRVQMICQSISIPLGSFVGAETELEFCAFCFPWDITFPLGGRVWPLLWKLSLSNVFFVATDMRYFALTLESDLVDSWRYYVG